MNKFLKLGTLNIKKLIDEKKLYLEKFTGHRDDKNKDKKLNPITTINTGDDKDALYCG